MEAAFKATEAAADENDDDENNAMSAMKNVNKMQSKMSEVYELIDLQKKIENEIKTARKEKNKEKEIEARNKKEFIHRVLFPLAHFRQITNKKQFDVFAYPRCESDLAEFVKKNEITGEIMKDIFRQTAQRKL